MARRGAKVDGNQSLIVAELRALGFRVQSIAKVGAGAPDLVVGHGGRNWLFEVKQLGEKLNKNEERWHQNWTGQVAVIHNSKEAVLEMVKSVGWNALGPAAMAHWLL
ncbi:MAG: hypothetical protein SFW67_28600 [Myxococcaceae bacterium]|nr:hypothetical protein [Myxococcaceae bacterium]